MNFCIRPGNSLRPPHGGRAPGARGVSGVFFSFACGNADEGVASGTNEQATGNRTSADIYIRRDFRAELPDFQVVAYVVSDAGVLYVRTHGRILRVVLGPFALPSVRKTLAQRNRDFLFVLRRRRHGKSVAFCLGLGHDVAD